MELPSRSSPVEASAAARAESERDARGRRRPGWAWLGRVGFEPAAAAQERLRLEVLSGARGDTLLLLEHDPIVTLGRSADPAHVLFSPTALLAAGIAVARASRGGDVTYHGPGQLVGYPVVRLRGGVRAHVRAMADAIIDCLSSWGVRGGHYRDDAPGVWVPRPLSRGGPTSRAEAANVAKVAKIAAFGIHVRHRISIHGFSLNVCPRLEDFSAIVPCGLSGAAITSVEEILGRPPPPLSACASQIAAALAKSLDIEFCEIDDASELLCEATALK